MCKRTLSRRAFRPGFTLAEMLVVFLVLAVIFALISPALLRLRMRERLTRCQANLSTLAAAMQRLHDARDELPYGYRTRPGEPYGGPGAWYDDHGWYSRMGPYIGRPDWFNAIDFSVSFSHALNNGPRREMIPVFGCPDDGLKMNEWHSVTWARVRGNYVVNFGNTNYGQQNRAGVAFGGAPFGPKRSMRFEDIQDGISTTLLMSEVITTDYQGPQWGGPPSDLSTSLGGQQFNTWLPPNSPVFDEVARLLPPAGSYNGVPGYTPIGGDSLLQTYAARSKHVGGVNASMCDGSVRWISNTIDPSVWRALSTTYGAETNTQ